MCTFMQDQMYSFRCLTFFGRVCIAGGPVRSSAKEEGRRCCKFFELCDFFNRFFSNVMSTFMHVYRYLLESLNALFYVHVSFCIAAGFPRRQVKEEVR